MKKLFYSLFAITMVVFSFTSCEDVPEPYNIPEKPGTGGEGGEEELQGSGAGTLLDPYDCIAAINYCKQLGADTESTEDIYIKGKIVSIEEEYSTQYGNGSFTISNDGSNSNTFKVWRALYLGNKKYTSGKTQIQVGDEVVIYGKVIYYYGNTAETSQGNAYLYSLNGVTEGGDEPIVPVEGEYINESFASSFGSFTLKNVKGTPWVIDYSSAKATGYDSGSKSTTPSDSYIVSSAIDLSKSSGAYVTFSYILRYFTNYGEEKPGVKDEVLITDNYTGDPSTTKWTDISGKLTEGSDWTTWYTYSMDIPAEFISKSNVVIALHYTCEDNSATWEVKNLVVKEGKAEQGGTDEPGGGDEPDDEPGAEVGDGMTVSSLISGQVGDIALTENSYGSQNVSNESTWYSWKYDNVTYQGAKVCKANGNFTGCIQVQGNASDTAKQGFFFNKTAFAKDIKTITLVVKGDVKYDSPTEYGVYAGTEAHPVSSAITASTSTSKGETLNTYTMVYDFSGGSYKYFTVWNNKVGALYIEKIVIELK